MSSKQKGLYDFSLLNCHILCPSSCYHGLNYENVLQPFWWVIVTRPFVLVYQFYFYMPHPIRSGFLKSLFSSKKLFERIPKWQLKSLKKMVVLSAKFIILISWSPICIDINENCNYFSLNNIVGGGDWIFELNKIQGEMKFFKIKGGKGNFWNFHWGEIAGENKNFRMNLTMFSWVK